MNDEMPGSPGARNSDPNTSKKAAVGRTASRTAAKYVLLEQFAYAYFDGRGLTDREAVLAAGWELFDEGKRRRCSTLRSDGYIEPMVGSDGQKLERYDERTRAHSDICTITVQGAARLLELKR